MEEINKTKTSKVGELELRFLFSNFRKQIEFSLLHKDRLNEVEQICACCVELLIHGLNLISTTSTVESLPKVAHKPINNAITLKRFIDDFEWVRSTQICRNSAIGKQDKSDQNSYALLAFDKRADNVEDVIQSSKANHFLQAWTLRNLKDNCLRVCLQTLVSDKELLESYYTSDAFLRNDRYATAFFICLSALELNQFSLLSQIDVDLYSSATSVKAQLNKGFKVRSNSHPNFSISPPKTAQSQMRQRHEESLAEDGINILVSSTPQRLSAAKVVPAFRKIKSLPLILESPKDSTFKDITQKRPRSKTVSIWTQPKSIEKMSCSLPQCIPISKSTLIASKTASNTPSSYSDDDMRPSTSAASRNLQFNLSSSGATNSSSSSACSTKSSTTTACRIELIKCDDIKIWTDQSCQESTTTPTTKILTDACAIPKSNQTKNISPISSFLSSLFGTPHSWTTNQSTNSCQQVDIAENAGCAAYPSNSSKLDGNNASGVFDSFMPIYGKKLRLRKPQNLFEDGVSSLDYSSTPTCLPTNSIDANAQYSGSFKDTPKNCQSLTAFLQMAQLSRNNTELEKENAHFRISEAIISAIEHIKWAKLEPDKSQGGKGTTTATDWLSREQHDKNGHNTEKETMLNNSDDLVPYAELSDSCLDLLSAEVVGLSLISKFNDEHLPRVSELKWLVSEEDTPQKLLPMPDNSPTANPDEHIIASLTRGTRYWAPPRQQIIFTEHPPPKRKLLIQKQNNRCAGCGMRVSPQNIKSFRYCTYLGKYHCTGCHRNQISATPAKILQSWDFKCYPVSVFAYRLLEQMYTYPLFYVPDLNPVLYVQCKDLLMARNKRIQLKYVQQFIQTCRFATREQTYFNVIPDYIISDPDSWSMSDFIDVHSKSMGHYIDDLISKCEQHILNCVLCKARGFYCEYCHRNQIIYPWQIKTFRCDRCGACFHINCWKSMSDICCRCQRINKRNCVTNDA